MTDFTFDPFICEESSIVGVPVFLKHLPWVSKFVYINIGFRSGGRYDPIGKEGLAHFCEHMPFDGCVGYETIHAIEKVNHELFMNTLNAHTSADDIIFEGKCLTEHLPQAFSFLADFILHPILTTEEVDRERDVIIREIWRRYESSKNLERIIQIRKDILGDQHVLVHRKSPLGYEETVKTITPDEIRKYIGQAYIREHMCIVIVGDITDEIPGLTETFITNTSSGTAFSIPQPLPETFISPLRERIHSHKEFFGAFEESAPQHTELEFTRVLPPTVSPFLLNLAVDFLREALWIQLRAHLGATYAVSLSRSWWKDTVIISFHTHVPPDRADEIRKEAIAILEKARNGSQDLKDKFEEVKMSVLSRTRSSEWTAGGISSAIIDDFFLFDTITTLSYDYAIIESFTFEDVTAFIARWFKPEDMYVYTMTP